MWRFPFAIINRFPIGNQFERKISFFENAIILHNLNTEKLPEFFTIGLDIEMSATQVETQTNQHTLELRSGLEVLTRGLDYLFEADGELPEHPGIDESVPHAPVRTGKLTEDEKKLAIANALRYFPKKFHAELAKEFAQELRKYNHIYMYRFRPTQYKMMAHPISMYPTNCKKAASIMLMIQNNLDSKV